MCQQLGIAGDSHRRRRARLGSDHGSIGCEIAAALAAELTEALAKTVGDKRWEQLVETCRMHTGSIGSRRQRLRRISIYKICKPLGRRILSSFGILRKASLNIFLKRHHFERPEIVIIREIFGKHLHYHA